MWTFDGCVWFQSSRAEDDWVRSKHVGYVGVLVKSLVYHSSVFWNGFMVALKITNLGGWNYSRIMGILWIVCSEAFCHCFYRELVSHFSVVKSNYWGRVDHRMELVPWKVTA